MVTFHPTVRKHHHGFQAKVIVRNPKGQCVGSKVSSTRMFTDADAALAWATQAAHSVVASLPFTRVAS